MNTYDIMMIGHISKDIMIDYVGKEIRLTGGAVVYSSAAAAKSGAQVMVLTKAAKEETHLLSSLRENGAQWHVLESPYTTSIRNVYHTKDQERRDVTLLSQASPFDISEIPQDPVDVYHLAALFRGEIPFPLIEQLSRRGRIALDAQGVLRCSEKGEFFFEDWKDKEYYLPMIHYFKVDTAEAEILTGLEDREAAARKLARYGAKEVMLTHNSEVIVCHEDTIYRAPYTNRSFDGRTGRGDTTFAAYLSRRREHSVAESVTFAAALCSIKMETPGPFSGTVSDVLERIKKDYQER